MPIQYRGTRGTRAAPDGYEGTVETTRHWCFCCWLAILFGAALLFALLLYFLEDVFSGVWSLGIPQFGARPMTMTVAEDAKSIDICVRDFGCEDGDRARLELNGNVIFEGELFRQPECLRRLPVFEGANQIALTALNGTGGRGGCPNNVNTGEVTIMGNDELTEMWEQPAGATAVTTMHVSVERNEGDD